jgi:hypothetical protein
MEAWKEGGMALWRAPLALYYDLMKRIREDVPQGRLRAQRQDSDIPKQHDDE